jgi:hypothetical protein
MLDLISVRVYAGDGAERGITAAVLHVNIDRSSKDTRRRKVLKREAVNCCGVEDAVFLDVTPCGSYKTDVSEERRPSIIKVTRIGELGTTLAVTSNRRTLRRNTKRSTMRHICSQRASVASYG